MTDKRHIAILGSTGSIGRQALDVVRQHKDRFEVELLTANNSSELLIRQALEFMPANVVICNESKYQEVADALQPHDIKVFAGMDSVCALVRSEDIDIVLTALVGFSGLRPTVSAIEAGEQGDARGRRFGGDGAGEEAQCADIAGGFGAFRYIPMPYGCCRESVDPHPSYGFRRSFPFLDEGGNHCGDTQGGIETSPVEDGREDYDRLRDDDEQGLRDDRGEVAFRYGAGEDKHCRTPSVHHSFNGGIR